MHTYIINSTWLGTIVPLLFIPYMADLSHLTQIMTAVAVGLVLTQQYADDIQLYRVGHATFVHIYLCVCACVCMCLCLCVFCLFVCVYVCACVRVIEVGCFAEEVQV